MSPLKRSFLALQGLQARLDAVEQARREPIAIVGLGCRVPGASGLAEFWELLRAGVDAITEVPADRWNRDALKGADSTSPGDGTSFGGFLRDMDTFDPQFFGIAPREAVGMDPQQRIFLEVCWEALEHAGIAADRLKGARRASSPASARPTTPPCRREMATTWASMRTTPRGLHTASSPAGSRTARPQRPQHGHRHGLLLVARRSAPGLPESAVRGDRPGIGRWRQHHCRAGQCDRASPGPG